MYTVKSFAEECQLDGARLAMFLLQAKPVKLGFDLLVQCPCFYLSKTELGAGTQCYDPLAALLSMRRRRVSTPPASPKHQHLRVCVLLSANFRLEMFSLSLKFQADILWHNVLRRTTLLHFI